MRRETRGAECAIASSAECATTSFGVTSFRQVSASLYTLWCLSDAWRPER